MVNYELSADLEAVVRDFVDGAAVGLSADNVE